MFENMNQSPFMMPEQNSFIDIDNNSGDIDIDVNQANTQANGGMAMPGVVQTPIVEPMRERVVNRTIEHVVPHVCPFM